VNDSLEIGVVVGGSLARALEVRLHPGRSAALGQYVVAPAEDGGQIVGMVTDILLKSAEAGPTSWPPVDDSPAGRLLREVLLDTGVYTAVEVTPFLELGSDGSTARARRLPRHFAPARLADQATIDAAFATEAGVVIGSPLGMPHVQVAVDIERLFERSVGIFGKSGTGKSVLTLLLLDAMLEYSAQRPTRSERIVALVFDMHDDYGDYMKFAGPDSNRRSSLRRLHPTQVAVYTLDPNATGVDGRIVIGTRDIEIEDLEVLRTTADFTGPALEAAYDLQRLGQDWIDALLEDDPPESVVRRIWGSDPPEDVNWGRVASRLGIHPGSLQNLRRGLRRFTKRPFVQRGSAQISGVLDNVVDTLLSGRSVVIQFGRAGSDLTSYMLVANMLSRRIWDRYRERVERALRSNEEPPNRLVIVIEEAHKFVDRTVADRSIFGQIARELRKYNVTLLVIDQRPSQIDPEVLSQIGTKVALQLDSEADVDALVSGVTGRSSLRQVIASLESQQQALVFGHAVPMPVVVRPPDFAADHLPGGMLRGAARSRGPSLKDALFGRRT